MNIALKTSIFTLLLCLQIFLPQITYATQPRYELVPGDRINISIFGREDLSGSRTVRSDSSIALHLIGETSVSGKTAAEVEAELQRILIGKLGSSISVSVEIERYQPVFVVGGVQNPGAYDFSPGMNVIKAIALSGGHYRLASSSDPNFILRATEEAEALTTSKFQLATILVEKSRLVAERDDLSSITQNLEVEELTDSKTAEALYAQHELILNAIRKTQSAIFDAAEEQKLLSTQERQTLSKQRGSIQQQIKLIQTELDQATILLEKGLGRRLQVFELTRSKASYVQRLLETTTFEARAAQQEADASSNIQRSQTQRAQVIAEVISNLKNEIIALRANIAVRKNTLSKIYGFQGEASMTTSQTLESQYEIQRLGNDGTMITLPAAQESWLLPGDVLRVIASGFLEH